MILKSDIEASAIRIKEFIHRTPIFQSNYINHLLEAEVFFKCENFQKTGSFKARGATNSILKLSEKDKENGVATHSSGNHGQALAWAAQRSGVKCTVVMPNNAPEIKKAAVKGYNAHVIECQPTLAAREKGLSIVQEETKATFVPPFNYLDTIEGQATAAYEVFDEVKSLDFLLCPVGGGGLLSGSGLSSHHFSPKTKVLGCEPEMANDAWQSFQAKKRIPVVSPDTIADGLKTSLGDITFPYILDHVEDILLCTEDEIRSAMRIIWERMNIIIEPSSAVALACAIRNKSLFKNRRIAIILTGGNVDLEAIFS